MDGGRFSDHNFRMSTTTAEMQFRKSPARPGRAKPAGRVAVAKTAPRRRRSLFEALRSLGPVELKGR